MASWVMCKNGKTPGSKAVTSRMEKSEDTERRRYYRMTLRQYSVFGQAQGIFG
jgi:hypothetical protein